MGRIFSYEEILEGRLPTRKTFDDARRAYDELVTEGINDGWLDGAFIYGSVALGLANMRSDFDVMLALTDSSPEVYVAAKGLINTIQDSSDGKIPLVPIVQPRNALEAGRHEMDRFFGQHLSSDFRVVEGNDPADYISYAPTSAGAILSSYVFQKKRRITNAYISSSPLDFRDGNGIQRMLELPPAVGRKALQALAEIGYIDAAVDKSADKSAVLIRTRVLLVSELAQVGFNKLIQLDRDYNDLLSETLKGCVSKKNYEEEITGLHAQMPVAISWLTELENSLLSKFELP